MITYRHNLASGFSLIETLVAVSILLIIIVGPMTITARSAKSSTFASEQAQAFFLAQEGVELVQKARDDLLLQDFSASTNNAWSSFTSNSGTYSTCYSTNGCGLQWSNSTEGVLASPVANCSTPTNCLYNVPAPPASVPTSRSKYQYNTAGKFTRQIILEKQGDNAVRVRSAVTWRTGSLLAEQRVEVETYLYNIYYATL